MDRQQLAQFLRSRRARVTPSAVGLPQGQRRRTPGLRREEVAQLAGMSVDYYTRLEQARGPHPSRQILNALGRALMLTTDERAHLFHLAGETPSPAKGPRQDVPDGILHLLQALDANPAYVLDAKYEMLAWNAALTALWGDFPPGRRNIIRWIFAAPDIAERLRDPFVRGSIADLRAAAGRYPDDASIGELVNQLRAESREFAALWAEHEVKVRRDSRKTIEHPEFGPMDLFCQVLEVPDRDQRLIIYTAEPGSPSQLALCSLRAKIKHAEVMVGLGQG